MKKTNVPNSNAHPPREMLPPHHLVRRTTSVLDEVIQGRPSFKAILTRADRLDLGHGDSSSAEAIATYFLRKQQDSIHTRLLEQEHLRRIGFRNVMSLLWFSSHCSCQASLLCGSLYKVILDAKLAIVGVQEVLEAPSRQSQVGDLHHTLADLKNLLSEHVLDRIRCEKDLFIELDGELKRYLHRIRVRALSRMSALKHSGKHGMSRYRHAVNDLKAGLRSRLCMTNTNEDELLNCRGDTDDYGVDVDVAVAGADSSCLKIEDQCSDFIGFSVLHKAHVRLVEIQKCMHAVSIMFDTFMSLVKGCHNQTLNEHLMESLRDEPLMFEGVAEQIPDCHLLLRKHLDDLREQVLICFCFINNARDRIWSM